jgi:hypothetical protein
MADYINLVDIENNIVYDLGKTCEAKYYLPYLGYKFKNKPILIFGDETHGWLENKYKTIEFDGEYKQGNLQDFDMNNDILDNIEMSKEEFYEIFDKIGGEIITNLDDYIKCKYKTHT